MSAKLLIDNIIRQTMVLVAHISTAAGLRAPLSHVAGQVFLDLVQELEQQGLTRRVVADMFGMALRSYQVKVQRLSESANEHGRSLWEAVLVYIQEQGEAGRGDILVRFAGDGSDTVASVLVDLTASGLVTKIGKGAAARYRAVSDEERALALGRDRTGALPALIWVSVYHLGEVTEEALAAHLHVSHDVLAEGVAELIADGRLVRKPIDAPDGGTVQALSCEECIIPLGEPLGWEAAVVDHHQAMTTALINKLRAGQTRSVHGDLVGGSTWANYVWPGHPHYDEVVAMLQTVRDMATEVRTKVTEYNRVNPEPAAGGMRVIFYAGQNVVPDDDSESGGEQ